VQKQSILYVFCKQPGYCPQTYLRQKNTSESGSLARLVGDQNFSYQLQST